MAKPPPSKVDIIRGCVLFSGASEETLRRLAESSTLTNAVRGTNLFFAGDDADGLRIVVSGMVRIWMNSTEGRELTLALLEPGDAFGEIALIDGRPRSANATVRGTADILMLSRTAFEDILETDRNLQRQLIAALCEMLRQANRDLGGFAFRGLGSRLAIKLRDLAMSHATIDAGRAKFQRKFSQTELAHMLGATREAVNKRMGRMTEDGIIAMEDGFLVIPSLQVLADWADGQGRD